MPKIFLGISLLLIMGSAVLGFLTKSNVAELKNEKQSVEATLSKIQIELKTAQEEAKKSTESSSDLSKKIEDAKAEIAKKQSEAEAINAKLAEAQSAVTAKEKEVEELKNKPAVTVEDPAKAAALLEATEKLQQAEAQLAEIKGLNQTLDQKLKSKEEEIDSLQQEKKRREQKVVAQGLEGKVMAYNPAWNFAVVSIGDKQGVVPNAEMVVQRSGVMIARARISKVEPNISIADIVPGTLQKDMRVQPGDKVVYVAN